MSNFACRMLMGVLFATLFVSSVQAGPPHFGGLRNAVSNKFSKSGGRPSISTMDAIKAQNFATDVKNKLKTHRFEPSTMDVIKASNALSDLKSRVKSHLPH